MWIYGRAGRHECGRDIFVSQMDASRSRRGAEVAELTVSAIDIHSPRLGYRGRYLTKIEH